MRRIAVRPFLVLILMMGIVSMLPVPAVAQELHAELPSIDQVQERINMVEADSKLTEDSKNALVTSYKKSIEHLEKIVENGEKSALYIEARSQEAKRVLELREEAQQLKEQEDRPSLGELEQLDLNTLLRRLEVAKTDRAAAESQRSDLNLKLDAATGRISEIKKELTELKQAQLELVEELEKLVPKGEESEFGWEARYWEKQTLAEEIDSRIEMLDQELISHPTHYDYLKAQLAHALRQEQEKVNLVAMLEEVVAEKRRIEAEKTIARDKAVETETAAKDPVLKDLAQRNADLGIELKKITEELAVVIQKNEEVREKTKKLESSFHITRKKLEIAGASEALGQLVLDQRRRLPSTTEYRKQSRVAEKQMAESGLRQIHHKEEIEGLLDIESAVQAFMDDFPPDTVIELDRELLHQLLSRKRELLDKLISVEEDYLIALAELDISRGSMMEVSGSYSDYLSEHLFWVRSTAALKLTDFATLPKEIGRIVSPANWRQLIADIWRQLKTSPVFDLLVVMALLLLLYTLRLKSSIASCCVNVGQPMTDRFFYTLKAIALSTTKAAAVPLLLGIIVWQINQMPDASEFSKGFAASLKWIVWPLFSLLLFRAFCMPGGVFEGHFGWNPHSLKMLRQEIRYLLLFFIPMIFLAVLSVAVELKEFGGTLVKLAFVAATLVLTRFLYRVLNPRKGVVRDYLARQSESTLKRLQFIYRPIIILIPLVLIVLSLAGYLFGAATALNYLTATLWLMLMLVIGQQMAERWLLVARRKLAYQSAMEQREALLATGKEQETEEQDSQNREIDEKEIDLVTLSSESRKLIRAGITVASLVGIWIIWSDVIPAFNIFNEISLWSHTTEVDGVKKDVPVTLMDLILAIVIAFTTYVAAKNLPSLLEIILRQQFSLSAASRYTIRMLTSYVIIAVGVLVTINIIGGSWSQVQWLVAALSVGIGFGLQEIVANFISGLIILFERPIRVGDFVTVGESNGRVSRIQIRATTIETLDNQELLVPNKEFITGRLLNWSLTDRITRVIVAVGIPYGGNVDKAMRLMEQAAKENEHVLKEPAPHVLFQSFGDSALQLELRCFVDSVDRRIRVSGELHYAINKKFAQEGMEIPFPQRDVHLDINQPLDVRLEP